jgi:heterotetrameric sarcosine oxidase delta subunit
MLLIPCPHCGDRDEVEFDYGGRALDWPSLDAGLNAWHATAHLGNDNAEVVEELWYHGAGCERWIRLRRHLSTHQFIELDAQTGGDE